MRRLFRGEVPLMPFLFAVLALPFVGGSDAAAEATQPGMQKGSGLELTSPLWTQPRPSLTQPRPTCPRPTEQKSTCPRPTEQKSKCPRPTQPKCPRPTPENVLGTKN
jgi:hypothetical protein